MTNLLLGTTLRQLRSLTADPGPSDVELLRRFAAGRDADAFAALVRRHGRLVWSVCRNALGHVQDAEDAFQATFLALARGAASIRNPAGLPAWLHGVAYRVAMRVRRDAS